MQAPIPLGLYVHVPWCVRKCPYCDFNSHPLREALPERPYVDALLRDLEAELPAVGERRLLTVFIGGGTPSLLSGAAVDRLLSGIRRLLPLDPSAEITLEANPGTVEAGRFREFRDAGVNRLSLGVQSFNDEFLARLGRIHGGQEARAAVEVAQAAGFGNLNLDLMYGLPGQDPRAAVTDITTALALGASHLSWYQLTLEANTAFQRDPPVLPDEDVVDAMELQGREALSAAGFERYEISAYARPGFPCRHNLNYWNFGDYLGIGAGAHGKLTDPATGKVRRTVKHRHPRRYLQALEDAAFRSEARSLQPSDLIFEFMLNALRLPDGFPESLFAERTGLPLTRIAPILAEACSTGLLAREKARIGATRKGLRYLNEVVALFVP